MAAERRSSRLKTVEIKCMKEDDGSDSWGDSDGEETPARRPAARKAASRAPAAQNLDPNVGGAKKRVRTSAATRAPANLASLSLMDIASTHPAAIPRAAKEWVARYKAERAEAMAELLTLLVQVAGCSATVSDEDVEEGDVDALVQALTQAAMAQPTFHDPLHSKANRGLRERYCSLWEAMVAELHTQGALDDFFVDKMAAMVTALSCSVVRSFRLAGTLTAAQLTSSWVRVQTVLAEARDTAEAQLRAEEGRQAGAAGGQGGARLRRQRDQAHHRVQDLSHATDALFSGVFAHRFRDVSEEVREVVIAAIGGWTAALPSKFLNDQYLKYLAWAMSDRHEAVRLAAVRALLALYTDSGNLGALHDFTERFTARFLELPEDRSDAVAAAGLRLLALLARADALEPSRAMRACGLLRAEAAEVRASAAQLAAVLLDAQGRAELAAEQRPVPEQAPQAARAVRGRAAAGGGRGGEALVRLTGLLHLMDALQRDQAGQLLAQEHHRLSLGGGGEGGGGGGAGGAMDADAARGLVDALWGVEGMPELLTDWQLLVSELGDERANEARGRSGCAHLASLLQASLARATAEDAEGGGRGARARAGAAGARAAAVGAAAAALAPALPRLLRAHQADAATVAPLVGAVRCLALPRARAQQQQLTGDVGELVRCVRDAFLRHSCPVLLKEAAASLVHCARHGPPETQEAAQQVLQETAATAAAKVVAAAEAVKKLPAAALADGAEDGGAGTRGPPSLAALSAGAARCAALLAAGASQLAGEAGLAAAVEALLQGHVWGRQLGAPIVRSLLQVSFYCLMWRYHQALSAEDEDAAAELASVTLSLARTLQALATATQQPGGAGAAAAVARTAYLQLTDVITVAGSSRLVGGPLEAARLVPDQGMLDALWSHCRALLAQPPPERPDADADDWDDAPLDTSSQQGRLLAWEEECEALAAAQVSAVSALGRLLLFGSVEGAAATWVGARVVSCLAVHPPGGDEPHAVEAALRLLLKQLRRSHAQQLPGIYLASLKASFGWVDEAEDEAAAREAFRTLGAKIAATYAGFNLSVGPLLEVLEGGLALALSDSGAHLLFLEALIAFVPKLPPGEAQRLASSCEAAAEQLPGRVAEDEPDEEYDALEAFVKALKARGAGQRPARAALKRPAPERATPQRPRRAAAAAATPSSGGVRRSGGGAVATRPVAAAAAAAGRAAGGRRQSIRFADWDEAEEGEAQDGADGGVPAVARARARGGRTTRSAARPPPPAAEEIQDPDLDLEEDGDEGEAAAEGEDGYESDGLEAPPPPPGRHRAGGRGGSPSLSASDEGGSGGGGGPAVSAEIARGLGGGAAATAAAAAARVAGTAQGRSTRRALRAIDVDAGTLPSLSSPDAAASLGSPSQRSSSRSKRSAAFLPQQPHTPVGVNSSSGQDAAPPAWMGLPTEEQLPATHRRSGGGGGGRAQGPLFASEEEEEAEEEEEEGGEGGEGSQGDDAEEDAGGGGGGGTRRRGLPSPPRVTLRVDAVTVTQDEAPPEDEPPARARRRRRL